jgi:hypothetical protein
MCLTCGCMQAHLEMGEHNIDYDDLKRAADENGKTMAEVLDIFARTADIDRGDHPDEYASQKVSSAAG